MHSNVGSHADDASKSLKIRLLYFIHFIFGWIRSHDNYGDTHSLDNLPAPSLRLLATFTRV